MKSKLQQNLVCQVFISHTTVSSIFCQKPQHSELQMLYYFSSQELVKLASCISRSKTKNQVIVIPTLVPRPSQLFNVIRNIEKLRGPVDEA